MTNDDRFDELLQEAAREHNSAPATPRAEMWAAIAAARGKTPVETAPAAREVAAPVRVIPLHSRHRRAFVWVAGLAATLLVGIMIGRSMTPAPDVRVAASATPHSAASSSADDPGKFGTGPLIPAGGGPAAIAVAPGAATTVALAPDGARHESRAALTGHRSPDVAVRATVRDAAGDAAGDAAREAALPYRIATMQHLMSTEALLVSLRSDVRAGRRDTTIASWAGQLLGTTRMLMDSPAGRDPQLKQLLDDLELVLAQISRLPGAQGEAADLGLIDDAVRHRQIMTRLRALSPDT